MGAQAVRWCTCDLDLIYRNSQLRTLGIQRTLTLTKWNCAHEISLKWSIMCKQGQTVWFFTVPFLTQTHFGIGIEKTRKNCAYYLWGKISRAVPGNFIILWFFLMAPFALDAHFFTLILDEIIKCNQDDSQGISGYVRSEFKYILYYVIYYPVGATFPDTSLN